jgi:hypothetical protein
LVAPWPVCRICRELDIAAARSGALPELKQVVVEFLFLSLGLQKSEFSANRFQLRGQREPAERQSRPAESRAEPAAAGYALAGHKALDLTSILRTERLIGRA